MPYPLWGLYLALPAGPAAGLLLAQVIRWGVGRRRSRHLRYVAVAGMTVGILLGVVSYTWWTYGLIDGLSLQDALSNLSFWVLAFLATTTIYRVLR